MVKKLIPPPPAANPNLLIPSAQAAEKISRQIEKGGELAKREIQGLDDRETLRADKNKWASYTTELLKRIFDQDLIATHYEYAFGPIYMRPSFCKWSGPLKKKSQKTDKTRISSERLELIPELNAQPCFDWSLHVRVAQDSRESDS